MIETRELTHEQLVWLRQRGDRNNNDVMRDKGGLYVLMGGYDRSLEKVYLPTKE
jgi:hypothetical protein